MTTEEVGIPLIIKKASTRIAASFPSPASSDKWANLRAASALQHPLQNRVSRVRIFLLSAKKAPEII
ncbi:MAG: hypothetical protein E7211_20850 [Clostridium lundense]|nr:hypothetical protein [Clostridium lundense]